MPIRQDNNDGAEREEDQPLIHDSPALGHMQKSQRLWQSVWQNNKGMFLILLAEVAGSSVDAIARFLQQGDHGMHSFQVRKIRYKKANSSLLSKRKR